MEKIVKKANLRDGEIKKSGVLLQTDVLTGPVSRDVKGIET